MLPKQRQRAEVAQAVRQCCCTTDSGRAADSCHIIDSAQCAAHTAA